MKFINPLKAKYPIVVRLTTLLGISLVILNFLLFPRFGNSLEFEDIELAPKDWKPSKFNHKL